MSLKIYLLGQFKLQTGDQPIELPSRPSQSLLAYLALNAGITHRREKLAALLWPEATESNARSYLRQALWRVRKALDGASLNSETYLKTSDISLTFVDSSDYWLDADQLLSQVDGDQIDPLIEIAGLYQGELLPGFYDEWVVSERQRLTSAYHQKMNALLEGLIREQRWEQTLKWSEHWIRHGYSPEPAFRALLHAYAGLGDMGMLTDAYRRCVDALDQELNVEPSVETQHLYEQLQNASVNGFGVSSTMISPTRGGLPPFLTGSPEPMVDEIVFVTRERELERLRDYLDAAMDGRGRIVFITGEAGSGKTSLLGEFTRQVIQSETDGVIANGNCNAHTGVGDPYLPFREILELLTGDVEARWDAGAITDEHAKIVWNTLPITVQALVEDGPDLIGTFLSSSGLSERIKACTSCKVDWLAKLGDRYQPVPHGVVIPGQEQTDLFEQYTHVLKSLARAVPLVLMVDDLQWADTGSISLLFHLCRNLAGSRILILGAYRPEEVAIGRAGERHPLAPVINELQREFGDITIDLNQAQDRAFIDAVLDSEPNRLGGPFRDMLYSLTRGHPLFTIELLRGLQERRDLVQNAEAEWIESSQLNFETLPARVEAVIGERIDRLDQSARDTLRVASVEGEVFTAGVIAQIQSTDVRELIASLSGDLDRRHHIVRAHKIKRVNAQRISCYRFRNYLFQKYLYDLMDEVERAFLHEDVGNALEDLYGEHANEIAVQLAWHFGEAGIAEKAIRYLIQAGEQAVHLSAYQEAIAHLENGMEVLNSLPASLERDQLELDLQLALGIAWVGPAGFEPRVKQAFTRAHELAQLKGQRYQLCRVLGELSIYHYVWAEHQKARDLAEEALSLAQRINDPLLIALQNSYLGFTLFAMGEYSSASEHFKVVMDIYKPEEHHRSIISLRGSDTCLTAYAYMACCLWCLGYPDQAEKMSEEVLSVTRNLGHPFTLIDVLCFGGCLFNSMRRDADLHIRYAIEFKNLANEKLHGWLGQAIWQHGEALAMMGHLEEGIAQMKDGIYHRLTSYERCYQTGCIRSLAEAQAQLGDIDKGLAHIDEALSIVNKSQEQHSLADIYRTRAEILLMKGDKSGAEEDFLKAIKVARQQQAKSWELRATIGLARLWNETGKGEEARQMLVEIYNWFTEGFDTPDLKEAEALIEQLA